MEEPITYVFGREELAEVLEPIMQTIEFFEGMSAGIGVTTAKDMERRLVELRKAATILGADS